MSHKKIVILTALLLFLTAYTVRSLSSAQKGIVEGVETNAFIYGFNIPDYAGQYNVFRKSTMPGYDSENNRIPQSIVAGLKPMAVSNSYWDPPGTQTYTNNRWELSTYGISYWPKVITGGPQIVLRYEDRVDPSTGDIPFDLTLGCDDPRVTRWLAKAINGSDNWDSIRTTAEQHRGANWFVPPHEPQNPLQTRFSDSMGQTVPEWITSPRSAVCLVRKFVKTVRSADPTAKLWFPTLSEATTSTLTIDQWLNQFNAAEEAISHKGDFDVNLKSVGWEGLALTWYPGPAGCGGNKYNSNCLLQMISGYKNILGTYPWIPRFFAFAEIGITHGQDTECSPSSADCVALWLTTGLPQLGAAGVKAAFFYALDLTWWGGSNPNHGLCIYDKNTKTCPWTAVGSAFYTLSSQYVPIVPCPRKSVGDFNCDGTVTLVDFDEWRNQFTGKPPTNGVVADTNGDGKVTLVDFNVWRAEFTES
ncbi:MAG: dockerin type I domain-containing protein [bacterium]|nr:dockerin type I domain-containing protein [bacterium]